MWEQIAMMALGLGSSVYGQAQAAKQAKEMEKLLNRKERGLDTYFQGELSKNVLDTDYAKTTLKKLREQYEERQKRAASTAAITGASDEARVAEGSASAKSITDAVTALAQYGAQRKDVLQRDYLNRKDALLGARMGVAQGKQESAMNLSQNAWNTIGSAIMAGDWEKGTKTPKSSTEANWWDRIFGKKKIEGYEDPNYKIPENWA